MAHYPDTAVIMVSGVDRPQRVRDALRLGAYDYLIKPCEMESLANFGRTHLKDLRSVFHDQTSR
ncbi:MAG: hypothetical protein H0U18_03730 [Pyrinomonadaceae bacterium]|nr:hypothetical protein [Pyrinomonadaceae bacterium]